MKDNKVDDEAKAGEAGEMRDALLELRPLSRTRPSQGRPQSYADSSSACKMKAEKLCQDREKLVPSAKSSTSKIKVTLPTSELRIDGSLRNWPYVFDHGEQMGKTLEEAPIYACHLIYSHNSGTPIIDPVLRTALARFSTIVPKSPNGLANDFGRKASTSQDENENSVFKSDRSGNVKIALKIPEYPDYLLIFGRWSGHRLSTVPDSYAFWLIEQAVKRIG